MRVLRLVLLLVVAVLAMRLAMRRAAPGPAESTQATLARAAADAERQLAADADSAFADSVERSAELRDLLRTRLRHTYLAELLATHDSMNFRWPDRRDERMRVWVQEFDAERRTLAQRIVAEAFEDWAGTGIPIAFTVVPDSSRAEVRVTWVDRFEQMRTGVTHWGTTAQGWIVSSRIELARRQSDGRALDSTALAAIARHEVGHLLGLGHTTDQSSIMAARITVAELSPADRATIRLVYDLPPGRLPVP